MNEEVVSSAQVMYNKFKSLDIKKIMPYSTDFYDKAFFAFLSLSLSLCLDWQLFNLRSCGFGYVLRKSAKLALEPYQQSHIFIVTNNFYSFQTKNKCFVSTTFSR